MSENEYTRRAAEIVWKALRSRTGIDIRGRPYVSATKLQEVALEWARDVSGPKFIWLHYMDVHSPWYAEPPFSEHLSDRDIMKAYSKGEKNPKQLTAEEVELLQAAYQGSVRKLDSDMDTFIKQIKSELNDPRIWVTSDHGELFGEGGRYFHPACSQRELFDIPLLTNQKLGDSVRTDVVSTVDIVPTILDDLGEDPSGFDGISLRESDRGREVFAESGHSEDGKLIRITEEFEPYEVGASELPSSVQHHATKLKEKRGSQVRAEEAGDLEAQLKALGYK
jgi:arylsulfatase A-like enzyme